MQRQFSDVAEEFYKKSKMSGKLERIYYTSNTYDEASIKIKKDALVYVPYGYDEKKSSYNVLYLMHGGGGNSDEIFGGLEATTDLKAILDNMIEKGIIQPILIVAPSFYYEGCTEALTSTKKAGILTQNFHHELVNDLIPVVESSYSVKKGREHRAFGGYSMGSEATWNVFAKCLDEFKYFLPMSGDCWAIKEQGGLHYPKETVEYLEDAVRKAGKTHKDYKIFACVGDNGVAYKPVDSMLREMMLHSDYFLFAEDFEKGNIVYCVAEGGTHSYEYCYKYLFNALPHFF